MERLIEKLFYIKKKDKKRKRQKMKIELTDEEIELKTQQYLNKVIVN